MTLTRCSTTRLPSRNRHKDHAFISHPDYELLCASKTIKKPKKKAAVTHERQLLELSEAQQCVTPMRWPLHRPAQWHQCCRSPAGAGGTHLSQSCAAGICPQAALGARSERQKALLDNQAGGCSLSVRFVSAQIKFQSSRLQLGSRCVSQAVPDPSPGACLSPACFPQTSPVWKVLLQVSSSPFPSLPH